MASRFLHGATVGDGRVQRRLSAFHFGRARQVC